MRLGLSVALSLLTWGCGPSFEAVYEGNIRFEHCYRLDRDAEIASPHREYCWKQWVHSYTYGQPQDRVEYAKRRIRVLRGEPPPGLVAPVVQASPVGAPASEPAPLVAAPVVPVPAPSAAVEATANASTGDAVPGDVCASGCRESLTRCRKGCQTAPKGCAPCESEYNTCMRHCFE